MDHDKGILDRNRGLIFVLALIILGLLTAVGMLVYALNTKVQSDNDDDLILTGSGRLAFYDASKVNGSVITIGDTLPKTGSNNSCTKNVEFDATFNVNVTKNCTLKDFYVEQTILDRGTLASVKKTTAPGVTVISEATESYCGADVSDFNIIFNVSAVGPDNKRVLVSKYSITHVNNFDNSGIETIAISNYHCDY
jgi:hypothetical protein